MTMITRLLVILLLLLQKALSFTPPGDSISRRKEQNFRNEPSDDIEPGDDGDADLGVSMQDDEEVEPVESHISNHAFSESKGAVLNQAELACDTATTTSDDASVSARLGELSEAVVQQDAQLAEAILMQLADDGFAPRLAYDATIRAWLSLNNVNAALQVMARLEQASFSLHSSDYWPFLKAFIRIGQPNQAIKLVNHMALNSTGSAVLPSEFNYNDPKRSSEIWSELECSVRPDARCLMIICNEFVKKNLRDKQRITRLVYEWAKEQGVADNYLLNAALTGCDDARDMDRLLMIHSNTETHAMCYMTVISAYARQKNIKQRGKKMESVLRRLDKARAGGAIQPDLFLYRQILEAHASGGDAKAAASFLNKVFEECRNGKLKDSGKVIVDVLAKRVLDAIAKSQMNSNETEQWIWTVIDGADSFLQTRNETVHLDLYHFAMDTTIRARKGDSVRLVVNMYSLLLRRYRMTKEGTLKPNTKSLNIVLKAYSACNDPLQMETAERILQRMEDSFGNGKQDQWPDVVSYTTLVKGWLACRDADSIQRAGSISKRMYAMYEAGNEAAKPDHVLALSLMHSNLWPSQQGTKLADEQVAMLIERTPVDLVCIAKLMKQWRSSDGGKKAELVIDRLLRRYEAAGDERLLPDSYIWTAAISAWGRSQLPLAAKKAELILDKLILLYGVTKSAKLRPNTKHFESVIRAYSQPNQPDKAENAKRILDRMFAMQAEGTVEDVPSRDALTAVLKACAHAKGISFEKPIELQIARQVYEMIDNEQLHNEATYGAYVGALRNCMARGQDRSGAICSAFQSCCTDGFVDGFVLEQMKRSLHWKDVLDIVGSDVYSQKSRSIDYSEIPDYWRRNIKARR